MNDFFLLIQNSQFPSSIKKKSMCIKWHANLSKEHAAAASLCGHGWMSKLFSVQNVTGHVLNISGAALWPRTMT